MSTVLIIEDNPDNMLLISDLLMASGYKTHQASTGLEGVEMALAMAPDFILLDIQLPDIDGFEVLKRILAIDGIKSIPIVATTSFAMSGDREKLLAAGCKGYIEKPIDPNNIVSQIESILEE